MTSVYGVAPSYAGDQVRAHQPPLLSEVFLTDPLAEAETPFPGIAIASEANAI